VKLVTINYGTLPTAQGIHTRCRELGLRPDVQLRGLRELLRQGNEAQARALLNVLGFTWPDAPTVPDAGMQEAIDSVAAALDDEATT
jgi:hypothetical protein